jgi:hypothetical protein
LECSVVKNRQPGGRSGQSLPENSPAIHGWVAWR